MTLECLISISKLEKSLVNNVFILLKTGFFISVYDFVKFFYCNLRTQNEVKIIKV